MLENILKRVNLFDVLFILIASIAIVGFWRGVWHLMDIFVFPNNYIWSAITTILAGILILIIMSRYK
ncbi:MAG: hypothetical protein KKF50_03860 [Nanoarchaeota archaeon]|nr:hypothetical protein [Nanoarchaeota archaeon]